MDSSSQGEDIDVSAERQRVLSGGADDDVMRIENLTKVSTFFTLHILFSNLPTC